MSTIAVDNIRPSAGGTAFSTGGVAKAWCRYSQVGVEITNSENVSSVTDNGTGLHTINFSNAFSADTHCGTGSNEVYQMISEIEATTATYCRWYTRRLTDGVAADPAQANSHYTGDLA